MTDGEAANPRQSTACKTPSFNDLANALGTGLAESMDHAAGGADDNHASAAVHGMGGATAALLLNGQGPGVARAASVDPHRALSSGGLRVETPDTYSRQSRHSSRMGSGSDASGVGTMDFLNPASLGLGQNGPSRQQLAQLSADQLASHLNGGGGEESGGDKPTRYTAAMMSQHSSLSSGRSQLVGGNPSSLAQASGLGPPGLNGLHANMNALNLNNANASLLGGRSAVYPITAIEPASRNGTPAPGLNLASRGNTPHLSSTTPVPQGAASGGLSQAANGLLFPLGAAASNNLTGGGGSASRLWPRSARAAVRSTRSSCRPTAGASRRSTPEAEGAATPSSLRTAAARGGGRRPRPRRAPPCRAPRLSSRSCRRS